MGEYNNPVKTKCWEKYLNFIGCTFKQNNGSHHIWECPKCKRPIVFWGNKKDIPRFHIKSNLKTMEISNSNFNKWAKANC